MRSPNSQEFEEIPSMFLHQRRTQKKKHNAAYQLEEDEREDAGEEAHDGNPHDDFEDVVLVEGSVLRDLDLLVEQEGPAEGVQHDPRLRRDEERRAEITPSERTVGRK